VYIKSIETKPYNDLRGQVNSSPGSDNTRGISSGVLSNS